MSRVSPAAGEGQLVKGPVPNLGDTNDQAIFQSSKLVLWFQSLKIPTAYRMTSNHPVCHDVLLHRALAEKYHFPNASAEFLFSRRLEHRVHSIGSPSGGLDTGRAFIGSAFATSELTYRKVFPAFLFPFRSCPQVSRLSSCNPRLMRAVLSLGIQLELNYHGPFGTPFCMAHATVNPCVNIVPPRHVIEARTVSSWAPNHADARCEI